jgi:hypothetical protein
MTAVPGFGLIDCVATTGDLEVLLLTGFTGRAAFDPKGLLGGLDVVDELAGAVPATFCL